VAKLKRDERLCPFCAETIKAAAIRCRYCQAELTPVEAELPAEPEPTVEAEPEAEQEPADVEAVEAEPVDGLDTQPAAATQPSKARRLTAILAALAVLTAVAVGVAWWHADHSSAVSAPDGTLVGDEPRSGAMVAAADLTQRALSYDYRTLSNDMEVARARMTPAFRKDEYDRGMAPLRANTLKNKIVVQADVVASSIITATEHRAQLLVFVNQVTSAKTTKAQQLDRNSLIITLVRGKGDWMLSGLTALG
jgi:Mce-associated membrane protein